jgi:3'-phosphoadenosine 5'-phosphosulfate sulfotransferase (PAPS reductase)/FAD synthetase
MQLTLDLPEPTPPPAQPEPVPDLHGYDLIVICSSAGKDSMAMLAYVADQIRAQDYRGRVVVLHNDLGLTSSGEPVEWPQVAGLAREHAERYGFEFVVRRRPGGGLWDQLLGQRRRWMANNARWCTADQKEGPAMTWITRAVADHWDTLGVPPHRPVDVLYCLGLRGEESAGRAAQPVLQVNERRSSGNRRITRWLPIRDWTIGEVWAQIRASGLRPHAAYTWGMRRLSCSLCVLASADDLMLAAALRPALAADYHAAEAELGEPFTERLSMAQILAALETARLETAGDPGAADSAVDLYGLVRDMLAATAAARGEGVTKAGRARAPWDEEKLTARAAARTGELLASARRAVDLAGRADTGNPVAGPVDEAAETALVAAGAAR